MTTKIKDAAAEYRAGLPTVINGGIAWTMETFSLYVNLLRPHVAVVSGQEWSGVKTRYNLVCNKHGQYQGRGDMLLNSEYGCQCHSCKSEQNTLNAGKIRAPRATKEEKNLASKLYSDGLGYREISRKLNRNVETIRAWLDPKVKEANRQKAAKWNSENKERKKANDKRYISEFEHGKASSNAAHASRRLLKTNTPEFVLIDNEWCEVDRKETYRIHKDYLLPPSEKKEIQELYLEAQHITEKTGIEHHVDHIQPLSKGGEHSLLNLQILPASENLSKNNTFRHEDQQLLIQRLFHQ